MRSILLTILAGFVSFNTAVIQNADPRPDNQNWRYLGTSTDREDYYYIRDNTYPAIVQMWYFSRKPNDAEVIVFLESYDCESSGRRLIRANTYQNRELVHSSS